MGRKYDLHVVTWRQQFRPLAKASFGHYSTESIAGHTLHTLWLLPNLYRLMTKGYPGGRHLALNQLLFRQTLRRLCRTVRPDVVIYSGSHHFTGFPPFPVGVPLVFDYVDKSPAWVEETYVRWSDAVVAVSEKLAASVRKLGKPTIVVPNGVDLQRYTSTSRSDAKQKLGLTGYTVISLIGLTCDPSLYFVDAVRLVQSKIPNIKLLIVGGGGVRDEIMRRCAGAGVEVSATGAVENGDVHTYFAATDVGLYPGADIPYFREACPLKVIEYTAASVQVVSSPVTMFENGWPNVRIAAPSANAFAEAILNALGSPRPAPSMQALDWANLAHKFDAVIRSVLNPPISQIARRPLSRIAS